VSALAAAGVLAQACAKTPTAAPTATQAAATKEAAKPTATPVPPTATPKPEAAKEAPILADAVKGGKLPALNERLPSETLVLEPEEKLGKYGGTWMFLDTGQGFGNLEMTGWVENFLKYTHDTKAQRPNLITKWEWNADGTLITLFFRKGIKWSDGKPLTVDDWLWWWQNMVGDDKVKMSPPVGTRPGGKNMEVTKVDDFTVKCAFAAPNPLFLPVMTRGQGARASSFQVVPAHAFQKYHYKFNTSLKDTDVQELIDRFNNRSRYNDLPHFGPWITKEAVLSQKCVTERNPYYWKTDTQGNQLPYFDGVENRIVQTTELIVLGCIAGEVDFQMRSIDLKNLPVLKENEAKGNYKLRMWKQGDCGMAGILFHYCYADKSITDLLWQQKFRQAMSYAIDRQRINDVVFLGLSRPRQIAMFAEGMEYQSPRGQQVLKDWENQCIEYDPEKAKKLLDEVGVVDKNNDGMREKPDGSALELVIDIDVNAKAEIEVEQLIQEDFKKVGLKWVLNVIDAAVLTTRAQECQSMLRSRGGAASGLVTAPAHWTPVEFNDYTIGGPPYGRYYQTGGKEGIPVPPGSFLEKLQKVYTDAVKIVDDAKRNDRVLDGYQIHIDEGPIQIGTVGDTKTPVVVKTNLINVPPLGVIGSWTYGWPGTGDPEMWFRA
jgi:peptide/nickel transport system substrate-binding protein